MVSKHYPSIKNDMQIFLIVENYISCFFFDNCQLGYKKFELLISYTCFNESPKKWHVFNEKNRSIMVHPISVLIVKNVIQGLVKLLIPVSISISNAYTIKELLDVILNNFSIDLQGQHKICESSFS